MKYLINKRFLTPFLGLALAAGAHAQALYSTSGMTLTEAFTDDNFAAQPTNTTAAWADNSTVPNWHSSLPTIKYAFGGGAFDADFMYGYKFDANGNTTAPAGALGTRNANASSTNRFGWGIQNNTGSTQTSFTLGYDAFVANFNSDAGPDGFTLDYKIGGLFGAGTYTAVPTGNYAAPTGSGAGNPVSAVTPVSSGPVAFTWNPGEILYVRWNDNNTASPDSGYSMGIDNVTFTAVPEPGTMAMFGLGLTALTMLHLRRRKTS